MTPNTDHFNQSKSVKTNKLLKEASVNNEKAEASFNDQRTSVAQVKSLQNIIQNSSRAAPIRQLQAIINSAPTSPVRQLSSLMSQDGQETEVEEQRETVASPAVQFDTGGDDAEVNPPPPSGTNNTSDGLPNGLKSGVESLSGHSMDDVKVHSSSSEPAQLNAHAFAQGSDIHLAPGQEKYLPHEAWHVAQQKQGKVEPTTQLKGKIPVNDDERLENEADVMGAKAVSVGAQSINSQSDVGFSREKEEENIQFKLTSNEVTQKAEVTEENKFLINDGVKSFNLFGQEVIVTVSGGQAKLKLNLTNPITGEDNITASGTIVNPSVDEAGFKFVSAHLATSDIVLPGGLKFTALEVNATPETYDGKGTFAAAGDKIKSAKGDVGITNDGNKTNYTLSNGELGIELFGQTIEVKGVTFDSKSLIVGDANVQISVPIPGMESLPKVSVQGLKIDKNNNWDFESISIKKGIDLDFLGFLKVGVQEMTVKKDAQGMQLSAMGGISGNLNVFGKEIGSFGGSGTLMHDFETEKTNKTLEGVSATLPKTSFPKDLIGIDGIGGNATIPVFPGVSIVAGASLSGGVNIPPLQLNFSQLSEDNYKISFGTIETPAAGFIQASLFVGAQLGYSALLSSDVTLNADGKIAALLAFDASKEISMGEKATKLELGNDESMRFNYELSGEAKLAAILKIRAKVLYFFTKEYNKTLAEKSLGKFKYLNGNIEWEKNTEPLENIEIEKSIGNEMGDSRALENEVPTKEEFIEKSTTYGYFGGENERKTISPVDEALGEYDLIRGEDKSAEKKEAALISLSSKIKTYLEADKGSRLEVTKRLLAEINNAISLLKKMK